MGPIDAPRRWLPIFSVSLAIVLFVRDLPANYLDFAGLLIR